VFEPPCTERYARWCERADWGLTQSPYSIFAVGTESSDADLPAGECGYGVDWVLNDGSLVISGSGEMYDYSPDDGDNPPWAPYSEDIISVTIQSGVETIGSNAFKECVNLVSVTLPPGLVSIGDGAFLYDAKLTSIELPEGIETIGTDAFAGCGLLSIVLPDSLSAGGLGVAALCGCSSLSHVDLGSGVTNIKSGTFQNCTSLTELTLPAQISEITNNCLDGCTNLAAINVDPANGSLCSVDGVLFTKDMGKLIRYPDGRTASEYTIPESVTEMYNGTFQYSPFLTTVRVTNPDIHFASIAFEGCSNLHTVYAPCAWNLAPGSNDHGRIAEYATEVNPVHGYAPMMFLWNDDCNVCRAYLVCDSCGDRGEEVTGVTVTSAVKTPATESAMGVTTYTATVTYESVEYSDSRDLTDIPKLPSGGQYTLVMVSAAVVAAVVLLGAAVCLRASRKGSV